MIADEMGSSRIRLLAPGTGKCPVCADKHGPYEPHNLNSLYYQARFFRKHRRNPTWEDAMNACSPLMKAYWRGMLAKKGGVSHG